VVKHTGRDPRLIWHAKAKHWVMAVYDEFEKKQWIAFYTSPDLKTWTFASRIEGFYECPDLFPLAVDPSDKNKLATKEKWVLYGADGKYIVGEFDGKEFKPDSKEKKQLWYGNFYAAQTFDNAPKLAEGGFSMVENHRRVQIGWASGVTFPGMPFNQQMTVPVELTLHETQDGPRLRARPVDALDTLREPKPVAERAFLGEVWRSDPKTGQIRKVIAEHLDAFDVELTLKLESVANAAKPGVTFSLRGTELSYDVSKKTLTCKGVSAPVALKDGNLVLRILVDRGSVEVFADGGRVAMSIAAIPAEKNTKLEVTATGVDIFVDALKVYAMQSAWGR
jgi:fructan beta-fructosidase